MTDVYLGWTDAPRENGAARPQRVLVRPTSQGWLESEPPTASQAAYRPEPAPDARPSFSIALITTFAPEPYGVKKPLPVSIFRSGEDYAASFFDANVHTSGDNEQEAFENIKSLILDIFDGVTSRRAEDLGPGPKQQLRVLEQFISKAW